MTYPLDPALYEDLTPSLSQNIAAGLGQNLGVYGMQQFDNYLVGNQLEKLGLPRQLAGLPKDLQQAYVKDYLQNRQTNSLLNQLYGNNLSPNTIPAPGVATTTQPANVAPIQSNVTTPTQTIQTPTSTTTQPAVNATLPAQNPPLTNNQINQNRIDPNNRILQQEKANQTYTLLSTISPEVAKAYKEGEDAKQKIYQTRSDREFDRLKPILKSLDEAQAQSQIKAGALSTLESAINTGTSGLSLDYLADLTGIERLRSPQGAQFLTASKEFFLGSLSRAGARPNQWIEQQLRTFLPQFGRSEQANRVVTEILRTNLAVEEAYTRFVNQVMDEDYAEYGDLRPNVQQRAQERWKEFADAEQENLQKRIGDVVYNNPNPENTIMVDKQGNSYSIPPDRLEEARKNGLKLYGES